MGKTRTHPSYPVSNSPIISSGMISQMSKPVNGMMGSTVYPSHGRSYTVAGSFITQPRPRVIGNTQPDLQYTESYAPPPAYQPPLEVLARTPISSLMMENYSSSTQSFNAPPPHARTVSHLPTAPTTPSPTGTPAATPTITDLHIANSPIHMRYGFSFSEKRSGPDLTLSENGLCVTHTAKRLRRSQAVSDETMEGTSFVWRMVIKHITPNTPFIVGVMDSSLWMPGQTLTEAKGAIVIDLLDKDVFVHGVQQRVFRREERLHPLRVGDYIDFFLSCAERKLFICLSTFATAREICEIDPFPAKFIACTELYAEGDSVQLEFPFPRLVLELSEQKDQDESIECAHSAALSECSENAHTIPAAVQDEDDDEHDEEDKKLLSNASVPIDSSSTFTQ